MCARNRLKTSAVTTLFVVACGIFLVACGGGDNGNGMPAPAPGGGGGGEPGGGGGGEPGGGGGGEPGGGGGGEPGGGGGGEPGGQMRITPLTEYGSLVFERRLGIIHLYGQTGTSQSAASEAALALCRGPAVPPTIPGQAPRQGDCQEVLRFRNACGTGVVGRLGNTQVVGVGWGASQSVAGQAAVEACRAAYAASAADGASGSCRAYGHGGLLTTIYNGKESLETLCARAGSATPSGEASTIPPSRLTIQECHGSVPDRSAGGLRKLSAFLNNLDFCAEFVGDGCSGYYPEGLRRIIPSSNVVAGLAGLSPGCPRVSGNRATAFCSGTDAGTFTPYTLTSYLKEEPTDAFDQSQATSSCERSGIEAGFIVLTHETHESSP